MWDALLEAWARVSTALHRQRRHAEARDELATHLSLLEQRFVDDGMTVADARRAALRQMGNVTLVMEDIHHQHGVPGLDRLGQDLRSAVRSLRRTPVFTVAALVILTVGLGACVAVFTVMTHTVLAPPAYPAPERVVRLGETWPQLQGLRPSSMANYEDWRVQSRAFEQLAAVSWGSSVLTMGAQASYLQGALVSANYFEVFGLRAILGRTFTPDEGVAGSGRVVVLSHQLWVREFSADASVLGRIITLNGDGYEVIGVMPSGLAIDFPFSPQLWRPLVHSAAPRRSERQLREVVGRLRRDVTLTDARAEMDGIAARLAAAHPADNGGYGVQVEPYPRALGLDVEWTLHLMLAAVGTVLCVGCTNLASLATVRAGSRVQELTVRAALGATAGRLTRQLLVEHGLLGIAGGLLGLLASRVFVYAMLALVPSTGIRATFPPATTFDLTALVWLFALALVIASTVAFTAGPVLMARVEAASPPRLLGVGGRAAGGRAMSRVRRVLVGAQVALSVLLLATSVALALSFLGLTRRLVGGFDATGVATAWMPTNGDRFASGAALNRWLDGLLAQIVALPGVARAAVADSIPTEGAPYGERFRVAGRAVEAGDASPMTGLKVVDPAYFPTVGLQLRSGRALAAADDSRAPLVAVVNDAFVLQYLRGERVVDRTLVMPRAPISSGVTASGPGTLTAVPTDLEWRVVGVVANEGVNPFDDRQPMPTVYVTREQYPRTNLALVVRTTADPSHALTSIRKAVSAYDPSQPIVDLEVLADRIREESATDRVRLALLLALTGFSCVLAAVGLFGIVAYAGALRVHELAIRRALGSRRVALALLVGRDGGLAVAAGLVIGVLAVVAGARLAGAMTPAAAIDAVVVVPVVAVVMLLLGTLAVCVPAFRASRVNPASALRVS